MLSCTTAPCIMLCYAVLAHPLHPQVSLARASRGMARLRMRLSMAASVSQGGAPQAMPSLMMVPSDDEISDDGSGSMPVLVSDPEPIWLNTDTKSR